MTISTLTKAGRRAAIIFLKHHGDIIDCKNDLIVSREDDTLVFSAVRTRRDRFVDSDNVSRKRMERFACDYLADHDTCDIPIRFDVISIKVLGADKCMVRRHVGAFAVPEKTFDVTKRSKLEDLLEELEENGDIAEGIAELILQTV